MPYIFYYLIDGMPFHDNDVVLFLSTWFKYILISYNVIIVVLTLKLNTCLGFMVQFLDVLM